MLLKPTQLRMHAIYVLFLLGIDAPALGPLLLAAEEPTESKPPSDADESTDYWWEGDPTPQGMITLGWASTRDNESLSTHGFRVAYGGFGIGDEAYGWAEYWFALGEDGEQRVSALGVSLVPIAILHRRLGLGFLLDAGLERRTEPDRAVLAGIVGIGADFVVRLSRRWDLCGTAEIDYRTTVDSETQLRLGLRYHHERLYVGDD